MKSFHRFHVLIVAFCCIVSFAGAQSLAVTTPEAVGMSSGRLDRLSKVFAEYAKDKKMAGSVILIARHGKIAYLKSFGSRDIEANSPMKDDAIFRIASQTKALISTGIMILQERGDLLISDPVSKYIPEFKETTVAVPKQDSGYTVVKAKRAITLRDLLTHTAGIGYGYGIAADKWKEAAIQGWYFANRDEPIGATVSRMASLPMESQPGDKFVYGYNTDILGVVIEKVSGMSLDEFIFSQILKPLSMNDTYFYLPKEKIGRLAAVYSMNPNSPLTRAEAPGNGIGQGAYLEGPRKSFSGGAGLLSTAADYAKFLQMTLNGGILNGSRILSRKSIELMTCNHIEKLFNPGEGFGLGFSVCLDLGLRGKLGSVGEYGWGGAYGSSYWVDPKEDLIVVYFKQLIPTNNLDDQSKLRALVYQAIVK